MSYLIDTNIFIRVAKRNDPDRQLALDAIRKLRANKEDLCYTTQVLVEFWNVSTRPATARGGLGHTLQVTERKAQLIEKNFRLLPESLATHQEWMRLVSTHAIEGVQVHDAMIAAVMIVHGVTHIVTFNKGHFERFGKITALLPFGVAEPFGLCRGERGLFLDLSAAFTSHVG